MPHVIVKLRPGKSEEKKTRLAEAITREVTGILGFGEEPVSVAMEEIAAEDWKKEVYQPDIAAKRKSLYKEPGYTMQMGRAPEERAPRVIPHQGPDLSAPGRRRLNPQHEAST